MESLVLKFAGTLFPSFLAAECKPYFDTPHGGVNPDIVLFRRDFEEWALVEVELEEHSANRHVKPQIGRLVHAVPDRRASRKIVDSFEGRVDEKRAFEALSRRPRVILVTHGATPVSDEHLRALGVEAIDVRIFSGGSNEYHLLTRHRLTRQRVLPTELVRSAHPMTRGHWTLSTAAVPEFAGRTSVSVSTSLATHTWAIFPTHGGYIFKMPTELSPTVSFERAQVSVTEGSAHVTLTPVT